MTLGGCAFFTSWFALWSGVFIFKQLWNDFNGNYVAGSHAESVGVVCAWAAVVCFVATCVVACV